MESELDQDDIVHRGVVPYRDQRDLETNLMNKKSCGFSKTCMVFLTSGARIVSGPRILSGPGILSFICASKY